MKKIILSMLMLCVGQLYGMQENEIAQDVYTFSGKALFGAIKNNDASRIRALIQDGADVNFKLDDITVLYYAIQKNAVDAATILINAGAIVDSEILAEARLAEFKSQNTASHNNAQTILNVAQKAVHLI